MWIPSIPSPRLARLDGQYLPPSFQSREFPLANITVGEAKLMGSEFEFKNYGESGLEFSGLLKNVAQYADDLAIIRSCYHDSFVHGPATNYVLTGSILNGHPSAGAWVLYGLGSENDDLPAFLVMTDGGLWGRTNKRHFGSGFLPAIYQGTLVRPDSTPIKDLSLPRTDYAERAARHPQPCSKVERATPGEPTRRYAPGGPNR